MLKSRLAVIMVADVVGYSRMMADDERSAISVVQEINDKYLAPRAQTAAGDILKRMGDGWIVSFGSVTSGVECATTVLQDLAGYQKAKLRIGSHIGEIVEDSDDFYGAGINLASRLQNEAPPGGLMISQDLFRQLTGGIAGQFAAAGTFELKNIPYPVEGFQWRPQKKAVRPADDSVPLVVVEPFRAAPTDAESTALTEDLREQLIMSLSTRTGMRTIDGAKSKPDDPTYALTGSVRLAGDKARVHLSLTVSETGETRFSRNYEGTATNFFEFADDMIARASSELRVEMNAYDANRKAHLSDDELSVSELRSRAAKNFYKGGYADWQRGKDLMERALCLNETDPMALAMRALSTIVLAAARHQPLSAEDAELVERDLDVSIQANARSDFAYHARAMFHAYAKRDADACLADSRRALSISPNYVQAMGSKAAGLALSGDFAGAISIMQSANRLMPQSPLKAVSLFPLSVYHYCVGEYEAAAEILEEAIGIRPSARAFYVLRGMALEKAGLKDRAETCRLRASSLPARPEIVAGRPALPTEYDELLEKLKPTELD